MQVLIADRTSTTALIPSYKKSTKRYDCSFVHKTTPHCFTHSQLVVGIIATFATRVILTTPQQSVFISYARSKPDGTLCLV